MEDHILYSTSACHLCELALELLQKEQQAGCSIGLQIVDISADDALFERYGTRIPVLRAPDGRELGWPFDTPTLRSFLATES